MITAKDCKNISFSMPTYALKHRKEVDAVFSSDNSSCIYYEEYANKYSMIFHIDNHYFNFVCNTLKIEDIISVMKEQSIKEYEYATKLHETKLKLISKLENNL